MNMSARHPNDTTRSPGGVISRDGGSGERRLFEGRRSIHFPSLFDLGRFVAFSGLTVLAAWIAGTGRVAYVLIMLVIAAALAYAVLDLVDYEIAKRKRRG